jgi:hypothetical protein
MRRQVLRERGDDSGLAMGALVAFDGERGGQWCVHG